MRTVLFIITSIIICSTSIAQQTTIQGVVKDGAETLPGVIVLVKGTAVSATTDLDGVFHLTNVPAGVQTLKFNFIGYDELEKAITIIAGQRLDVGTVVMKESSTATLKDVEVRGQMKEGEGKAFNMTKASPRSVNVIASETLTKLPDKNAAEAVQRLPGVVMESDQGEGRYISFRGTPSDWSSALVNSDRMPVADEDSKTRAMKFDIFPASLIDYVIVSKTLTPDIEGDAIGGSANFMTRSAPNDSILQVQVGVGYNAKAGKPIYNASIFYGDRSKNGKWGYLVGGSFYHRNWATDNYQIFYGTNYNHSILRLELRDYSGTRTTAGANFAVDYRFNAYSKIYAKGTYGQMIDDEWNRKIQFNYGTGVGQSIRVQNIHNIMDTRFFSGEFGGNHKVKSTTINWRVASHDNRFKYGQVPIKDKKDERNGYYVLEFEKVVRFTDVLYLDEFGNQTDEFNAWEKWKFLDIDSPVEGYGDPYNAVKPTWNNIIPWSPTDTMFLFTRAYTETNQTRERDPLVAQIDVIQNVNNRLTLQAGAKARIKNGERKVTLEIWDRNPMITPPIVYDNLSPVEYHNNFLPEMGRPFDNVLFPFLTNDGLTNFIQNAGDTLLHRPFDVNTPYYPQFIGSSYKYREDVYHGYIMGDWKATEKISVIGGIRAEYTLPKIVADSVVEDLANFTRFLVETQSGKPYLSLLPSVNMRWAVNKSGNLRAAASRSFRRPNFNELKPGQPAIDYTNFDLIYGNPELRPSYSWNGDVSYEHFFGLAGMFSVSGYYKYVTDHIYTAFETADLEGSGISNEFQVPGGVLSKKYINAPTAYVAGTELLFVRKFDFLKGALKDIGISANYTFTASAMKIPSRAEAQPLPRQSQNLANLALFYESRKIITRIALNYKDPYLFELNLYAVQDPVSGEPIVVHQNNDYDIYVGRSLTLDVSFNYRIGKHFSCFAEANNLTNTPFVMYRGRRDRPVKTEYYGVRGMVGIRYEIR